MKVEVIAIGDELLIGQTINTNAAWMGARLADLGASVEYCTVIRDERQSMLNAFELALKRVDVVLVTGGLGPTKDDITKKVICEFFDTRLVHDEATLKNVEALFASFGRPVLDVNVQQAMVPEIATILHNAHGTAPGIYIERDGKVLVSMPGVPYEMKYLMQEHVIPRIGEKFELKSLYYKTIQTQGLGETVIAQRIEDIEDEIRAQGIGFAYLPSPGAVRLRLSSEVNDEKQKLVDSYVGSIKERLPAYVFGDGHTSLQEVVGKILLEQGKTMSTVESCTGGAISQSIVSVPGSSSYFEGSVISYSNRIKSELVNVRQETLDQFGAVSKEVVEEMAVNGRTILATDFCVSVSGIAGPDGGSEEKPVGTVWIGVASEGRVLSKKFRFGNNRERNIRRSVLSALNLLRCELLEINIEKS